MDTGRRELKDIYTSLYNTVSSIDLNMKFFNSRTLVLVACCLLENMYNISQSLHLSSTGWPGKDLHWFKIQALNCIVLHVLHVLLANLLAVKDFRVWLKVVC